MKKIFYTYKIHGLIEVPDDVTDEDDEYYYMSLSKEKEIKI